MEKSLSIRTGTPLKFLSVEKSLSTEQRESCFFFRVQQTAMVCEHTMEQQSFLVQSMPSGVNTKHALLKLVRRFVTHGI